MSSSAYLIPLFLLVIGVLYLATDSDLLWSYHRFQLRAKGITSVERTPEWDFARKITGYGCIVCALIILLILAAAPSQTSATRPGNVGTRNADSNFTINGTPLSPDQMREMKASGLIPKDENR